MSEQTFNYIPSYPKVFNLGHKALAELWNTPRGVVVQEKIDGSQMSWAWDRHGDLHVRSKGKVQASPEIGYDAADGLFKPAIAHLLELDRLAPIEMLSEVVYRGEAVTSPRHNTLKYGRVPEGYLVLFDVEPGLSRRDLRGFSGGELLVRACQMMAIEPVRLIEILDERPSMEWLEATLEKESQLGGVKIEGLVFKNYDAVDPYQNKTPLVGKHVSEAFKEVHKKSWGDRNPKAKDVLAQLIEELDTEARYQKAVQHLAEEGRLDGSPKDIGPIMHEVKRDVLEEEADYIAEVLVRYYKRQIERALGRGVPTWYKDKLARQELEGV